MDKVSVIIPSYNRFLYLLNAIKSIQNQTYKNVEIIVVNDKSTQEEYYSYDWSKENITIIHLEKNSKEIYGYGCAAHVRNKGIEVCTGKYVAFCDDDDIWFPEKLQLQIDAIKNSDYKMCCTEALIGNGTYDCSKKYLKYNAEHFYDDLQKIYKKSKFLKDGFPKVWNYRFLKIHNCIICSSVLIEKSILDTIGSMKTINSGEDYDYWLRALKHTQCIYLENPYLYYDLGHADGQNY